MNRWGLLLAGLLGCAASKPRPAAVVGPRARDLFPLAIGNRWSYEVGFLGAKQSLSVSIVSRDGTWFSDSRGQHFLAAADGLRDEHRYLLKEPLEPGHGWDSILDVATTEHYKVTETGLGLDVPAGHFDGCVHLEARSAQGNALSLIAEQDYCPGVGLVRVVTFQEKSGVRGPQQWMQELTSYNVQPPG